MFFRLVSLLMVLLGGSLSAGEQPTIRFEQSAVSVDWQNGAISYPGCHAVSVGVNLELPAHSFLLELLPSERTDMIKVEAVTAPLSGVGDIAGRLADIPTSDSHQYDRISREKTGQGPGFGPVYSGDVEIIDGQRYARLEVFPVAVDSAGSMEVNLEVTIRVGGRVVGQNQLTLADEISSLATKAGLKSTALSETPGYVIVTSSALAGAFERLAQYKSETGYTTEIKLIGEILAGYPGRDDAKKLREYLKEFYASGGRFVLLGGDETVVPIRYAYHYRTDSTVPVQELQICDLYFADMTGDWDSDGDGVWGERYDDNADLSAELYVGRLPFSDTLEVSHYVDKLIGYETNPGNGDRSYLSRAFFFSSDEMRDYGEGGQHGRIAASYPGWFEIDTTHGVEQASGSDPSPTNATPIELTATLSGGYGFMNVLAHGRSDGFVVRSANYNEWPKLYMLTAAQEGAHGCIDSSTINDRPAFWYSLACENGAFDFEQIYGYEPPGLAKSILGVRDGGAVGFVAYSRWGWVGSSHVLQAAFFDTLFSNPSVPASEAFSKAKEAYYYYRDLVLGQNYFGDPTVRLWTEVPRELHLSLQSDGGQVIARVTEDTGPVADCRLILSLQGTPIEQCVTDQAGYALISSPLNPSAVYTVAAVKDGYTIARSEFIPSIATEITDDEDIIPLSFTLNQNYPNPFNPSTTISFELPSSSHVTLSVFNILGQEVKRLADGIYTAGRHEVIWDGRSDGGSECSSGIYFYRIDAGYFSSVRKMVLLR